MPEIDNKIWTPADSNVAAARLAQARHNKLPIAPLRESGLARLEDAYAIQKINTGLWKAAGRTSTGAKIGLTSKAVQAQLGVSEPDFGLLWGDLAFSAGDEISVAHFMQPKAEAEIAFVLAHDLVSPALTLKDVISAVACVLPAVEIVDSAIAGWNIKLVDTVADNASSGGYVLGDSPRLLSQLDLRTCGMLLSRDGHLVSHGVGAACLGNPLNALLWLARKMVETETPLRAGDLVLSGALGPMVPVAAGEHYLVEIQGFPAFSFTFK
ncbi:MAG: fumarylacetoacetate hydrolase family protein [Pseudomonadota bacterium]